MQTENYGVPRLVFAYEYRSYLHEPFRIVKYKYAIRYGKIKLKFRYGHLDFKPQYNLDVPTSERMNVYRLFSTRKAITTL